MIRKLLKIFKFNLEVEPIVYTTQNTPYLLNYEYYNCAWGKEHNGYFIHPNGNILHYDNKIREQSVSGFMGCAIYGRIEPDYLLDNLNIIEERTQYYKKIDINLNEIRKNLSKSGYEDSISADDAGATSFSIFIYDDLSQLYVRIILKTFGDRFITNKSIYNSQLLNYFINQKVLKRYKKYGL